MNRIISEIGQRILNNEDAALERYAIFQGINTDVLVELASGKVDLMELVRLELAQRGLGKDGKWIGFPQARQVWGIT
ncbi:MAG: hypothetical protein MN733_18685 [Nitrososphaera sp.]|nr:hypothetical protein [Nitrososphaera sp.]